MPDVYWNTLPSDRVALQRLHASPSQPTEPLGMQGSCSYSLPVLVTFLLQECLDKFGDSLQEMINYHMVSHRFLLPPCVLMATSHPRP